MTETIEDVENKPPLHEAIYKKLRLLLETGALAPGQALSLRNLAHSFEGSVTPVRDAVWRLAAEGALYIGPTRRISVPTLSRNQVRELMRVRALLEPEAAILALDNITPEIISQMRAYDAELNKAAMEGNVQEYMANNHAFHFTLYAASNSDVLIPLIESIWVRFGPYMRHAYPDVAGMEGVEDHHAQALDALEKRDAIALKRAIKADIGDGEQFLLHEME
ncbi:GntR family transcriptional regulator [Pseudaquidulcibacter saccharophilus]|uniref:GntR family transcriptional regulator n=1 Tax=Pseudaquidulcibacter saccharophilus TaxID=2831900 RepID=UPI001EFF54CC|nr:GntR family transcriptional regulator [Pseudaquidulcibacter saccharophilus]